MVHRRTKPEGAARSCGVLVGHVLDGREFGGGASPHYEILVGAGAARFRVAVNVRSADGSEVLALFDPAFAPAMRADLPAGAVELTALATETRCWRLR